MVGLELLVCLSTGLRCSLKRSLSRRLVSPMYCFFLVVTLYHVDNVFGVAINVMINKSSFAGRIKGIHSSKSVVYVTCKENTKQMNFKEDVRQHLHVFILITEFHAELCPGLKRVDIYSEVYTSPERRGGLTVSAPVSARI